MKILLATDGSESAKTARDFLVRFPFPSKSEVTVLTVIDQEITYKEEATLLEDEQLEVLKEVERSVLEASEKLVKSESDHLRDAGWQATPVVRTGHPAEEIIHMAEELQVDVVVVGSHGLTGLKHFLLGSVSEKVLSHAPCSVLIVRKGSPNTGHSDQSDFSTMGGMDDSAWKVLLAYDGSKPSRKAVSLCASFSFDTSTRIEGLTVIPVVKIYRQDLQLHLRQIISQKKKMAETDLENTIRAENWTTPQVSIQLRESENVGQEILEAARELDSNLIFLGHKGKSGIEKFFLGSVTNFVVKNANCAVWVVRG